MLTLRAAAAVLGLSGCAGLAAADVFFEIEPHDRAPDGVVARDLFGTMVFDVYVWGTNGDNVVTAVVFDLRSLVSQLDWSIGSLGTADPAMQFTTRSNGLNEGSRISQVRALSVASTVTIGTSPQTATLIYSDFTATLLQPGGSMDVFEPRVGVIGNPSPVYHSIGVSEVPAPSGLAAVGLGALAGARRRRR